MNTGYRRQTNFGSMASSPLGYPAQQGRMQRQTNTGGFPTNWPGATRPHVESGPGDILPIGDPRRRLNFPRSARIPIAPPRPVNGRLGY